MSNIHNASTEELQAEIERRKIVKNDKPKIINNPDLRELKKLCRDYIQSASEGYVDEDFMQYIFEASIIAFYGKNVFEWINKVLR